MRGVPMDGNAPHHFNHRRNPEIQDSMNAVLYFDAQKIAVRHERQLYYQNFLRKDSRRH